MARAWLSCHGFGDHRVRSHSAKRSPAGLSIAKQTRRRRDIVIRTGLYGLGYTDWRITTGFVCAHQIRCATGDRDWLSGKLGLILGVHEPLPERRALSRPWTKKRSRSETVGLGAELEFGAGPGINFTRAAGPLSIAEANATSASLSRPSASSALAWPRYAMAGSRAPLSRVLRKASTALLRTRSSVFGPIWLKRRCADRRCDHRRLRRRERSARTP